MVCRAGGGNEPRLFLHPRRACSSGREQMSKLREFLSYDKCTGVLTWKPRAGNEQFNKCFAGKLALHSINCSGYRGGTLVGKGVLAHRVIWKLVHGEEPEEIDHINGDKLDNRLCNLRSVTHGENLKNKAMHSNNKSGFIGVYFHTRDLKWIAQIKVSGRRMDVGRFDCVTAAAVARKIAEAEFGFHDNHGRQK